MHGITARGTALQRTNARLVAHLNGQDPDVKCFEICGVQDRRLAAFSIQAAADTTSSGTLRYSSTFLYHPNASCCQRHCQALSFSWGGSYHRLVVLCHNTAVT
jgi:hypothetical protein